MCVCVYMHVCVCIKIYTGKEMFSVKPETPHKENSVFMPSLQTEKAIKDIWKISLKSKRRKPRSHPSPFH